MHFFQVFYKTHQWKIFPQIIKQSSYFVLHSFNGFFIKSYKLINFSGIFLFDIIKIGLSRNYGSPTKHLYEILNLVKSKACKGKNVQCSMRKSSLIVRGFAIMDISDSLVNFTTQLGRPRFFNINMIKLTLKVKVWRIFSKSVPWLKFSNFKFEKLSCLWFKKFSNFGKLS